MRDLKDSLTSFLKRHTLNAHLINNICKMSVKLQIQQSVTMLQNLNRAVADRRQLLQKRFFVVAKKYGMIYLNRHSKKVL